MYLLFDIGGTNMRLAVSGDGKSLIGESVVVPTPQDFDDALNLTEQTARKLLGGQSANLCVVGVPGPLDEEKSQLVNAPNLPDWNNKPLVQTLSEKLGCKVILENDASMVGLGEALYGAGRGFNIVAYITVSTGVGGGRIVAGKIDQNSFGFEPGHQIIVPPEIAEKETPFNPGGTLEGYVSGKSILRRFNKISTEVKDEQVRDELCQWLAYGLHNTILHWSPDAVVLGGSVITKPGGLPIERVEYHLKRVMKIFPNTPPIKKAELGDMAGIHGALALARGLARQAKVV